jgi:hypothetical protein
VARFVGEAVGSQRAEAVLPVTGRTAVANALITATRHLTAATAPAFTEAVVAPLLGYGDEKAANRDTRVSHGATENGP